MNPPLWKADLHSHTTCSDGTYTVPEILELARSIGLSGLSITDHDTIEAYKTAPQLAIEKGLYLLAGVEFSTTFEGQSIHMLGYGYRLDSAEIASLCEKHLIRRRERNKSILEKLFKHGIKISEDELYALQKSSMNTIARPHIAQLMVQKGYVNSIQQAFHQYLGDKASCFVKGEAASTEETIEILHQAGAKAVLAHPHLIHDGNLIARLMHLPFDGMECYYGTLSADQDKRWVQFAEKRGLFITGGSDFHGNIKPSIPLGCSWVPKEIFKLLWDNYKKNNPHLPLQEL